MFIPLPLRFRDDRHYQTFPFANSMLVAVNVLIFCFGWAPYLGPGTGLFSVVGYAFGHVGVWHLAGNMLALLVFGTPVNRRLGNGWYLAVYFSVVLALGLTARLFTTVPLMGASGVIFAVIAMALMLFPSGTVEVSYFALFPCTLLIGCISRPKYWVYWLIRWDMFELRAKWGLLLVPLLEVWGLIWWGWNWSSLCHLAGLALGVAAVLLLPTSITMNRRASAGLWAGA